MDKGSLKENTQPEIESLSLSLLVLGFMFLMPNYALVGQVVDIA
jgi:hypothetical protein